MNRFTCYYQLLFLIGIFSVHQSRAVPIKKAKSGPSSQHHPPYQRQTLLQQCKICKSRPMSVAWLRGGHTQSSRHQSKIREIEERIGRSLQSRRTNKPRY